MDASLNICLWLLFLDLLKDRVSLILLLLLCVWIQVVHGLRVYIINDR